VSRARQAVPVVLLGALALAAGLLPGRLCDVALYPALGVFPGMLAARFLARREDEPGRWTVGLALSPLLAALLGWVLLAGGVALPAAARLIGGVAWAAWLLATLAVPAAPAPPPAPARRTWPRWAFGFAALVAALPLANPWVLVHFDGWFHAAMVWEVVQHGIPPESPNFAGPPSSYMWIYHVFVALLVGLGGEPFVAMALLNVANAFVLVALVRRAALLLWRDERAAVGAVALSLLGLNAGAWLLWPLTLLKALSGETTGAEEVLRQFRLVRPFSDLVLHSLSAPFAVMLSLLDKFTEGTALNYAWVLLLLLLWAALDWLGGGRRGRLVLVALAACGLFLFHGVVAFSAVPVLGLTLGAMLLRPRRWDWLPGRGRVAALAAALALGALAGLPYLLRLTRGWTSTGMGAGGAPLRLGYEMPWTLLTSLAVVAWLARGPLRRAFRERLPVPATVALYALATTLFTLVVHLPVFNESKFVFQVLFLLALVAGPAFHPWLGRLAARRGRVAAAGLFAVLFLVAPAMTVVGYVADPAGRTDAKAAPGAAESAVYAWIRERTEPDAVFLDARQRDLVMVHGRRRLYLGTTTGTEQFAFPPAEVRRRRAVMDDLYGACRDVAGDAAALRESGRPVYVLVRPEDLPAGAAPCVAAHPGSFADVYAADGYRVYRLR
jgi:hypothetical protein